MILRNSTVRAGFALVAVSVVLLTGCEREVILPGIREDVRSDSVDTGSQAGSRSIRLPAQRSNAEWAQPPGNESARTSNPALRTQPQLIWSVPIGQGDARRVRITADPVVAGGLIYTLDASARVSAVTPSGVTAWSTDLKPVIENPEDATGGGMSYAGGVLYVSMGFGNLAALDAASGTVRWVQKLEATGSGTPTVRDGLVYLVAGDDTGWAVETKTGRIAWQIEVSPSIGNVLGAPAPVLSRDLVVFAYGSGDLVGAFRKGGLRRWNASVAGRREGKAASRIGDITGGPMMVGNRVYVGNHSGRIAAFAVDSGERIWTAREGALGPIWPVGGSLFAVTDTAELVRLDAGDGSRIWAVDLPGFVKDKPRKRGAVFANYGPIVAGGRVITASNDGFLRFFAPEDGTLTASIEVPSGATTSPVVAGNTLYIVGTNGELHAFR